MKWIAPRALLPQGWAESVAIDIDDAGTITAVEARADRAGCELLGGPVIPAMPNLHSHAFQRALAGRTGKPSTSGDDSFWSWRRAMYAFLDRLDPDGFEAIAAQAYVEMAKAGYASVAEFHYVHHDAAGRPYADPAEVAMRIVSAAKTAGLGLTLLPVFYAHNGFGGEPAMEGQRRFVHTTASFAQLVERLRERAPAHGYVLGVAPHSLRAVTSDELDQVVRLAPPGAPVHIHAAEQTREVDECYAATHMRPVEWLLSHAGVDRRWCIVHATHMTEREIDGLASSGAVAGLAPTTEADLGDGIFPGPRYFAAKGRFGVGSDSNTVISPFDELRQLEWSQRLHVRRRNVLADESGAGTGASLWLRAAQGGAQAVGRPVGVIAAGFRADLVVFDGADPALVEQAPEDLLDAAIFGPSRAPVRDVLAGGRYIVREGRHEDEDAVLERYRSTLALL
ncbi:MAG TPA: formimidoylglutamate deiminase [Casimicrobiaceae bacterium]|nr:formimidoylglutamate deiminase [Casimicrobiaceae bacterium]